MSTSSPQPTFESIAARTAPAIFVLLWSTGFIGTKYVLAGAEPLT
ncbi:MAG: EamA/RhaT family transporter, partial [Afipia sp.]